MTLRRPETITAGLVWVYALLQCTQVRAHELPKGIALAWQQDAASDALPVVLTNRGLVAKDGDIFRIRCNEAYGATTAMKPYLGVASDGAWVVGTPEMAARSSDRGCTFSPTLEQREAGTGLNGYAFQTGALPTILVSLLDPERLTEAHGSQLLQSVDEGVTWSQRLKNADGELFSTLMVAPSRPQRVYATGYLIPVDAGLGLNLFARSDDGGTTFTRHEVEQRLTLLGVDPGNPDVVFASVYSRDSDGLYQLLRSSDAGETFAEVPGIQSQRFTSFTGNTDGSSLWLGTDEGLFRSSDHGASFAREELDYSYVSCLAYRANQLWMCALKAPSVEGVWVKDDGALRFEEFLTFDDVVKPMACAGDREDEVCRLPWLDWKIEVFPDGLPGEDVGDAGGMDGGTADPGNEACGDSGRVDADGGCTEPARKKSSSGCHLGLTGAENSFGSAGVIGLMLALGGFVRKRSNSRR